MAVNISTKKIASRISTRIVFDTREAPGGEAYRELIEYEERISQIAYMTGADPDLIKSRIEEYAKMKEKTPHLHMRSGI